MALGNGTIKWAVFELVHYTLKLYGGNRTRSAKSLGISIRTLRIYVNKMLENGYEETGHLKKGVCVGKHNGGRGRRGNP